MEKERKMEVKLKLKEERENSEEGVLGFSYLFTSSLVKKLEELRLHNGVFEEQNKEADDLGKLTSVAYVVIINLKTQMGIYDGRDDFTPEEVDDLLECAKEFLSILQDKDKKEKAETTLDFMDSIQGFSPSYAKFLLDKINEFKEKDEIFVEGNTEAASDPNEKFEVFPYVAIILLHFEEQIYMSRDLHYKWSIMMIDDIITTGEGFLAIFEQ